MCCTKSFHDFMILSTGKFLHAVGFLKSCAFCYHRNCWPIGDKQQEQQFRRGCNNWLSSINKVRTGVPQQLAEQH